MDDVNLVLTGAPHNRVRHNDHGADRLVRPAQVYQVIVGQVPLTACTTYGQASLSVADQYIFTFEGEI